MAEKDCVNFDFGDGKCPFGTSCFYRHAYRDGTLEVSTNPSFKFMCVSRMIDLLIVI